MVGITSISELNENFEENCIPESFGNMEIEDYSFFLEQRRKLMSEKIKKYYNNLG